MFGNCLEIVMKTCLFCQISQKQIPSKVQFESGEIFAFDDANPKAPVHILIIPKRHIENVATANSQDKKLLGEMILTAQKLAQDKKIDQTGYRLVFNTRRHAGQIVDHIHLHLIGGKKLGQMA
ncbi:MAG: Hit-like protein involved in cell-cycle regulation [Candidatus Berkelbacteria bacterium Licking1014_7]|uniref:Hit-like protein involved in cell-cycle regulation n=1 Tax=Candidatus Berkelbacteria bacterium Licking1014_7 TaxID=2017147 RepID=A0A554LIF2_9BACT|nr:MAG: Hit-like protein involved in cell-cycle regulation [Candidatus Berkelbacteria bacterium Licking1014_7]